MLQPRRFLLVPFLPLLPLLLPLLLPIPSVADEPKHEPAGGTEQSRRGGKGAERSIEGLWSGSWGGGNANGAVRQPVLAEMLLREGFVELSGFPQVGNLAGTVRLDPRARQLHITPVTDVAGRKAKVLTLTYRLDDDRLQLTTADNVPVTLSRIAVDSKPLANVEVEFVAATGINEAGDLFVTRYALLRVGESFARYFRPAMGSVKTGQATVFQVGEVGLRKITIDKARELIDAPTLVVLAVRPEHRASPVPRHGLRKNLGPPPPDGVAVTRTLGKMLRPGTLVFVLSQSENVPQP